jgi:hypothetical protein
MSHNQGVFVEPMEYPTPHKRTCIADTKQEDSMVVIGMITTHVHIHKCALKR